MTYFARKIMYLTILSSFVFRFSFASTISLSLLDKQGLSHSVVLNNYEISDAVTSPKGNFCSQSKTLSTWHKSDKVTLVLDDELLFQNSNNSFGWFNPQDTGLAYIFYYNTYTFKDFNQCMNVAKHGFTLLKTRSLEDKTNLGFQKSLDSFKLSFYRGPFYPSTSQVDYVLKIDYQKNFVTLYKLTGVSNQFDYNSWEVFAKGTLVP